MLKPLDEITGPDPQHLHLPLFSYERDIPRPRSVEALHAIISRIDVSPEAPAEVRAHFQIARNLLLYAWFVYRFATVAELHAYGCVEFALRKRIGDRIGPRPGLKRLVTYALKQGWISDEGFRLGRERVEEWERGAEQRRVLEEAGIRFEPLNADPQFYARIICETMPTFRNHLAHGNPGTFRSSLRTLEICAEIINQLFAESVQPRA